MKTVLVLFMILCLFGMVPPGYAEEQAHNYKDQPKADVNIIDTMKDEELDLRMAEAGYKELREHTLKHQQAVKQDRDALITIMLKAKEDRNNKKVKEVSMVLDDYNNYLVNLDLMLAILGMRNMIKEANLLEYYNSQKENHEKIKFGFSVKNEIYLARIDGLKDAQAAAYEIALLKDYRDYCIFDVNNLKLNFDEKGNVVEGGKLLKEGLANIKAMK